MAYLDDIKTLIEKDIVLQRRNRIYEENHRVNTYFEIGRLIVEAQGGELRAKYGNGLIKEWSKVLTNEYGRGYDVSNLKRMRKLYLTFQKGGPLGHLSWSHYRLYIANKRRTKKKLLY